LSSAPKNAAEAIALEPSICRSIPDTLEYSRIAGASIFPNKPLNRPKRPKVDRFFATLPSLVAVESAKANDEGRRGGIFTRELIGVYRNTPRAFVERVQENGQPVEVVTNRMLDELVKQAVEDAAFDVVPQAGQLPDAIVESVKDYMGRVERVSPEAAQWPSRVLHEWPARLDEWPARGGSEQGFDGLEANGKGCQGVLRRRRRSLRLQRKPLPPLGNWRPGRAVLRRSAQSIAPSACRRRSNSIPRRLRWSNSNLKPAFRSLAPA
jgi:hypothetical protein